MSCRTLLLLSVVAVGCSQSGGANASSSSTEDPFETKSTARAIKVTYFRFVDAVHAKKWEPEYRIMLSDGWMQKNGENPRELLVKLYGKQAFKAGSIPDEVLANLVREMVRCGLNDLRATRMEMVNLEELKQIERASTQNVDVRNRVKRLRIINVETEEFKKTVAYYDNEDAIVSKDSTGFKFGKVESEVIKVANQYTVQIRIDSSPAVPK